MSRARHHGKEHMKNRAKGGAVAYAGGNSNVMKEAKERKRGGRVRHKEHIEGEGEGPKHRSDRRARGGHIKFHHLEKREHGHEHGGHRQFHHHVKREHQSEKDREHERKGEMGRKHGGHVGGDIGHTSHHEHGKRHAHEEHRKGRKRGGGVGANLTPLSTAARTHMSDKPESED